MKKNINYLILSLLFITQIANAQIGTGLILEDEAYNATPQVSQAFAGSKFTELPLATSMKKYCPKVTHQGEIGSCVGWSSGYGAFTIMRAKEEGWTDVNKITENAFSALFIYNQVKLGDCYQGSLFSSALKLLKKQGDCLSNQFDYPIEDCNRKPSASVKALAEKNPYEVKDYFTLFRSTETGKEKIHQTKVSLSEGKPVIIGMMIRENFKDLPHGEKYWSPNKGNTTSAGGHAMVVVGYNDGRGAFEVMNSWGTDWGNDGFFWLKYEDFGKYCVYGYQLMIGRKDDGDNPFGPDVAVNAGKGKELAAEFVFRYPTGYDDKKEEVTFTEAATRYNGDYYTLKDTDWEENQRFQLVTRRITKNRYVYVFSVDPEDRTMIHWPRNEAYNKKFNSLNEGAIVPYQDVEIIVPGANKALIKDKVGKDHLFVLYSTKPIEDFVARVNDVKSSYGDDYMARLKKAFGNRLIASENIKYSTNKMEFTANTSKDGYIVPIMLMVETK